MSGHFTAWVAGMGPAAANHLWQSTACVAGAWLLTLALRRNQARVRHAVWVAASIKFLVPFSVLMAAGNLLPHARRPVAPVVVSAMDVVEEPFADAGLQVAPAAVHVATLRERVEAELPVGLFAVWVAGAAVVLLVWGTRWRAVRRIRREAKRVDEGREWEILRRVEGGASTRLGKGKYGDSGAALQNDDAQRDVRGIELRMSAERMEPGVFGVWRPVLVWPRALSARLDDAHIEAIVAHELAHVRRRDNLTAALHMLVETVFWFHPAVWWMERRMVKEREQACDEAVVEASRSRLDRTDLCDLEENKWGDSSPVRLGYASLRAQNDKLDPWGLDPTHRSAMNGARIRGGGLPPQRSLDGAPRDCSTPPVPLRGTDGAPEHSSSPIIAQERAMNGPPATSQTRDVGQPATYAEVYAEALLKTCRFCVESPLVCVAGVTGADLKQRVMEIVTGRALVRMSWAKKALVAMAAMCVVAAPVVLGQAKAAQRLMLAAMKVAPKPVQSAAKAMMAVVDTPGTGEIAEAQGTEVPAENAAADDMSLGPEFEVASIRPADPNEKERDSGNRVDTSGRFVGRNTTVEGLVRFAYTHWQRLGGEQVASEGPAWIGKEHFDVAAKLGDIDMAHWKTMSYYQRTDLVRPMVRRLLADRFHLRVRTEQRVTQVYALVIAKGGSRLKEVTAGPQENLSDDEMKQRMQDVFAHKAPPMPGSFTMSGESWSGTSLPMGTLAMEIEVNARLDAPLVNLTGLNGYYDFTMKTSYEKDGPPLIDQIEQQLGLKVEPRKMSLTYYVITSADHPSVDGAEVGPASVLPAALVREKSGQGQVAQSLTNACPDAGLFAAYDVVSVRPTNTIPRIVGLQEQPDGIHSETVLVAMMVQEAYSTERLTTEDAVAGLPDWAKGEYFAVNAKMNPAQVTAFAKLDKDQQKGCRIQMLRALLADRFKVQVHSQTRQVLGYDMVVASGGSKMKEVAAGDPDVFVGSSGRPMLKNSLRVVPSAGGGQEAVVQNFTLDQLAAALASPGSLGHKVVNKTGLTGMYRYTLTYALEGGAGPAGAESGASDPAPTVFNALEEQLGLKLVRETETVEVVVVDHVERPAAN